MHDRAFVREIFTYKLLLKNPRDEILHLTANIGNSDGFMLSGHKQLTLTIFSNSEFELTYNLYPLKANFQRLPEIKMEVKNYSEEQAVEKEGESVSAGDLAKKQTELNELLERWLPKFIFVHPPNRKSD
jgi:trafficking protein particle complex subunit 11